jgi:hypothetical protein
MIIKGRDYGACKYGFSPQNTTLEDSILAPINRDLGGQNPKNTFYLLKYLN